MLENEHLKSGPLYAQFRKRVIGGGRGWNWRRCCGDALLTLALTWRGLGLGSRVHALQNLERHDHQMMKVTYFFWRAFSVHSAAEVIQSDKHWESCASS